MKRKLISFFSLFPSSSLFLPFYIFFLSIFLLWLGLFLLTWFSLLILFTFSLYSNPARQSLNFQLSMKHLFLLNKNEFPVGCWNYITCTRLRFRWPPNIASTCLRHGLLELIQAAALCCSYEARRLQVDLSLYFLFFVILF